MFDADLSPSHFEWTVQKSSFVKEKAFSIMDQVDGWCSKSKAGILIDMILKNKPKILVEIGVYGGKSLLPMACALQANNMGLIYGIDPWDPKRSIEESMNPQNMDFWARVDHQAILDHLFWKIEEHHLSNQVVLIRASSEEAPPIHGIDLLHVDGNHSDKTSFFDVIKWVPLMNSGGWIIFDDMTWYENGTYTTARAVQWLDDHCIRIARFEDRNECEWGIWVKK